MTPTHDIQLKPSAIYAFTRVFFLLLATLLLLFLSIRMSPVFLWPALLTAVIAVCRYLLISSLRFTVTHELIRVKRGILFKRIDQVEMYRVKDYIILQPILFQLFGLMTLILKTTDPENPVLNFWGIPQSNLVEIIRDAVQEARKNNQIVEIN